MIPDLAIFNIFLHLYSNHQHKNSIITSFIFNI